MKAALSSAATAALARLLRAHGADRVLTAIADGWREHALRVARSSGPEWQPLANVFMRGSEDLARLAEDFRVARLAAAKAAVAEMYAPRARPRALRAA